ncbi:MAG: DUF5103 domain-containing protein [Bacteroidales bacterium]|jgi:hypothetical protein|nr:DUF5103 domain-containing protein [Bacteroidales bacterium]
MSQKKTSLKPKNNQARNYLFIAAILSLFSLQEAAMAAKPHERAFRKEDSATGMLFSSQNLNKDIKDFFLYGDYVYSNNIQSILFYKKGWDMAPPHIRFESDERLVLRFDDLDADYKDFYYTIIHCDAYWTPTNLQPFEYIDGFNEDMIRDYSRSINTVVPYTQYFMEFPSFNLRPRISGNYILKVYLNGNPDDVVFTRRFMVYEQQVAVEGDVRQATLVMYRDTHQQLSFSISTLNYYISNPGQDMKLVITQNGRWDNAIIGIQPRMIQGNRFIYDHEQELLFEAGNEFRHFDIRSLRFLSERLGEISSSPRHWEVFLLNDPVRRNRRYTSEGDLNGKFNIENVDYQDDMLESDYAWVYFSLPMNAPVDNASVHVMGALTNWNLTRDNEMVYNSRQRKYETSLFLKQGYYNYQYAVLEDGSSKARMDDTEGNYSEAENDYSIFVYHKQPGTLYDRLISIRHMNSGARQINRH